jgi:hypothetical protein
VGDRRYDPCVIIRRQECGPADEGTTALANDVPAQALRRFVRSLFITICTPCDRKPRGYLCVGAVSRFRNQKEYSDFKNYMMSLNAHKSTESPQADVLPRCCPHPRA